MAERQDTKRLEPKPQTLDDAYAAPANFLEVDVVCPETHGVGKKRYTDYEVRMRVSQLVMSVPVLEGLKWNFQDRMFPKGVEYLEFSDYFAALRLPKM